MVVAIIIFVSSLISSHGDNYTFDKNDHLLTIRAMSNEIQLYGKDKALVITAKTCCKLRFHKLKNIYILISSLETINKAEKLIQD